MVAPPGATPEEAFANVAAGRSSIGLLSASWASGLLSPIAAVAPFSGDARRAPAQLRMLDRVTQLALAAAAQALREAHFEPERERPQRCRPRSTTRRSRPRPSTTSTRTAPALRRTTPSKPRR
ncbi:MAG: hypothetical protein IT481_00210 [Gammaproteobacteria bacterium]|nr:hypothetical protein [Gammaproteobacteria bacterium]